MSDLKGKSIIVTGGGSGIGRATALLLGKVGAHVTVSDLNGESAAQTASMIEKAGGRAQSTQTDATSEDQVKAMVESAVATYGRLDGAANCAGRPGHSMLLHELSFAQWRQGIDVNLTSAFLCLKYQIPAMLKTGGGSIVLVSSTAALKGYPYLSEYAAAKAGIVGMVRCAAYEYGKQGIRVNSVLPGTTDTPMFRGFMDKNPGLEEVAAAQQLVGRVGQPEELGYAIRWLLSPEASYVTGMNVPIDGGQTAC